MNEDFGKSLKIRILEETLNELKRKNVRWEIERSIFGDKETLIDTKRSLNAKINNWWKDLVNISECNNLG